MKAGISAYKSVRQAEILQKQLINNRLTKHTCVIAALSGGYTINIFSHPMCSKQHNIYSLPPVI